MSSYSDSASSKSSYLRCSIAANATSGSSCNSFVNSKASQRSWRRPLVVSNTYPVAHALARYGKDFALFFTIVIVEYCNRREVARHKLLGRNDEEESCKKS